MNRVRLLLPVALGFVLVVDTPALGHHSHAMFDHSVEVTVTGTVTDYSFRNPHVYLYLDVVNEAGGTDLWAIEMSNIQNMVRRGITKSTFAVGDAITVVVHPLNNGKNGGNYVNVTAADGTEYD